MLGDVIRRGQALESHRIRVWKARGRVEHARRRLMEFFAQPGLHDERNQTAFALEEQSIQSELEQAELAYLCEREGWNETIPARVETRVSAFVLRTLIRAGDGLLEPPFFDLLMYWARGEDEDWFDEGKKAL